MKRSVTIGSLLTLVTILLVLVAAVVFLTQRNQELDQQRIQLVSTRDALDAAREQLASDVTVREAALGLLGGTRDALAGQVDDQQSQLNALEGQLSQQGTTLAEAHSELEELALQLFIFSPKEGAIITPAEPIELFVAARGNTGLDSLEVAVNDGEPQRYPAEGQTTYSVKIPWTPPAEGEYTISALARNTAGQTSELVTVSITAAYASVEARERALLEQVAANVGEIRLPQATAETPTPQPPPSPDLHLAMSPLGPGTDEEGVDDATLVLRALDFLTETESLSDVRATIWNQELLGYYDPDDSELVVFSAAEPAGPFAQWLQVHAAVHALQDERFQVGQLDFAAMDVDRRLALWALVEGEAALIQHRYLQGDYFNADEVSAIDQALESAASADFAGMPAFVRGSFAFVYEQGFRFVEALDAEGGFTAVDGAWEDQPRSTEHILHPDRYLAGDFPQAVAVAPLTGVLGGAWRLVGEAPFGEFYLRQLLAQQLAAEEVDAAATGWGGGRYAVYWNSADETLILALRLAWDSESEEDEFAAAYTNFLNLRYEAEGEEQADGGLCWQAQDVTCFYRPGNDIFIVRAPDLDTAGEIAAEQPGLSF